MVSTDATVYRPRLCTHVAGFEVVNIHLDGAFDLGLL
jgi:hypothetical protein